MGTSFFHDRHSTKRLMLVSILARPTRGWCRWMSWAQEAQLHSVPPWISQPQRANLTPIYSSATPCPKARATLVLSIDSYLDLRAVIANSPFYLILSVLLRRYVEEEVSGGFALAIGVSLCDLKAANKLLVMHQQSHQNTHPTFTYRKGRPPLNWAL